MKKTKVIRLFGGPGAGKTTVSLGLSALMKQNYKSSEYVPEYVKDWVYEGRAILASDQVYILAKQARKEQIRYNEVDYIVTDGPIRMAPVYEKRYASKPYICEEIVNKFEAEAKDLGVEFINIFLIRTKPYDQTGRYQTEEEAWEIDDEIAHYLGSVYGTNGGVHFMLSNENTAKEIYDTYVK